MSELNLSIYEKSRQVPQAAQKTIQAGRLKGKTDINPMWRIKILTELFGPCGIGWKYTITKQWIEDGANGEKAAFVNIDLFIKHEGNWSDSIPGTGGSSFIANEKNGHYTSDECFKMALTDAISVSCKALGVGADIYWDKDSTKYDVPQSPQNAPQVTKPQQNTNSQPTQNNGSNGILECADCHTPITKEVHDYSVKVYKTQLCRNCQKKHSKTA